MALFDPGFLTKLRSVALASQRSGGGLLAPGPAKHQAVGTELAGHRGYSPGDDYRAVDWNICARHDELVTRRFVGEADRHVYLLLDRSASMGLGEPVKFDAVAYYEGRKEFPSDVKWLWDFGDGWHRLLATCVRVAWATS